VTFDVIFFLVAGAILALLVWGTYRNMKKDGVGFYSWHEPEQQRREADEATARLVSNGNLFGPKK
jgi:hypothetical protein